MTSWHEEVDVAQGFRPTAMVTRSAVLLEMSGHAAFPSASGPGENAMSRRTNRRPDFAVALRASGAAPLPVYLSKQRAVWVRFSG